MSFRGRARSVAAFLQAPPARRGELARPDRGNSIPSTGSPAVELHGRDLDPTHSVEVEGALVGNIGQAHHGAAFLSGAPVACFSGAARARRKAAP